MDVTDVVSNVLEHHGVKGQKWGVRRRVGSGGSTHAKSMSELRKTHTSEDATKATHVHEKIKAGGTKTVSNAELQHLVNRMNLEQQFSRLSASSKQTSKGKKFAKEVLGNVAKQQVTALATRAATKLVGAALK